MKVIKGGFGKYAPDDLSQRLREMADEVDKGIITGMVVAYVYDGEYSFMIGTSMAEAIVLTTLLQSTNIERMKVYD